MEEKKLSRQARYYHKNKEKITAKRKRQYHSDPNYRQNCIDAVKKSIKKKSSQKKQLKQQQKEIKKNWRALNINGVVVMCCKGSYLAKQINRTLQTLRLWERNGFPKTIRVNGHRYYRSENYELVIKAYNKYKDNITLLIEYCQKNWVY